jgi:anti-sigma-K factor RskA
MTQPTQDIPEELHVLAGEYVLGALDLVEMRTVRRQAMADPALADAILGWERRLAPMVEAVAPLPPPEALWARIEQTVAPLPEDGDADAPPPLAAPRPLRLATVAPAPAPEPPRAEPRRRPQAAPPRRVWPWQAATAASLALAACVAGVVLMPPLALRVGLPMIGERFSPVVAVLTRVDRGGDAQSAGTAPQMASDSGTPRFVEPRPEGAAAPAPAPSRMSGFLAEARPDGTLVLAALAPVEVPAGKALELWIKPPGGTSPRSLGVLPPAGRRLILPSMPAAGTALMISLEPPGGSPTGAPTGPVVFGGKLGRV